MTRTKVADVWILVLAGSGVVVACGDSGSGEGGAGGSGSSSSSTSRSTGAVPTTAGPTSSTSKASSTGALPTTAPTSSGSGTAAACVDYCGAVQANCTVDNAQYASENECLTACASMAPGMTGDQTGNTIACRQYHADLAATTPVPHCDHAGPDGGGVCVD